MRVPFPSSAIVLAAGLGTRMRPITDTCPKPLVRIGGKAMLDHALDRLEAAGVTQAVVNMHYLGEQITAHCQIRNTPALTLSDEREKLLETGGGVRKALPLLASDPFWVANSDSLWIESGNSNLRAMWQVWDSTRMDALLLLARKNTSIGFEGRGDFFCETDGSLRRRGNAEAAPFVYAGMGLLTHALFADTPEAAFSLNFVFDRALEKGRLFGHVLDGRWLHVGTPEAISLADEAIGSVS